MLLIISLTLPVLISGLVLIFIIKRNLLKFLDVPLDHNIKINEVRLFGGNKTYRGLIVFVLVSLSVCMALQTLYLNGYQGMIHPVFKDSPILISFVYSLAYTIGELINSAVKRQMNINPGKTTKSNLRNLQKMIDLSDGIVVVAAMLTIFTSVTVYQAIVATIIGIGIHLGTDNLMQNLGLKQDF